MKRFLLASAALFALTTTASAADLAPRNYTKAPALSAVYNWTGLYLGAFGGYGWNTSNGLDQKGGFGGGTIGYNWQVGTLVYGLEVDAAGGSINQNVLGAEAKIRAFGSVTGRLGYAANNWLVYAKGGYAWANNKLSVAGVSESKTHNGYTVGAGLEYGITPNWSLKGEYLWSALNSETYGLVNSGTVNLQTVKFGANYRFNGF